MSQISSKTFHYIYIRVSNNLEYQRIYFRYFTEKLKFCRKLHLRMRFLRILNFDFHLGLNIYLLIVQFCSIIYIFIISKRRRKRISKNYMSRNSFSRTFLYARERRIRPTVLYQFLHRERVINAFRSRHRECFTSLVSIATRNVCELNTEEPAAVALFSSRSR